MGAGLSTPNKRRKTGPLLLKASRAGHSDIIAELLETTPEAAAYCTLEGLSSLHIAAAARRADILEQLLLALRKSGEHRQPKAAKKAFAKVISQKNVHGQTPLMLACRSGAADCVRLLLEAGADATLFDSLQQRTCLHYAALHGWAEAIEALLEDESVVVTPEGHRQPLRDTLCPDSQGHHRYVDGREGYGLAPLHLAASHGHLAAVKALLKWGASLSARCNSVFGLGAGDYWVPSSTPLHYAAASGRARVVHAILQAAAERQREEPHSVDIRLLQDFRGQRPYDVAASAGHRNLLWALNPRVPLGTLLQQPVLRPAVPRLAALAAAALRRQLAEQLAALRSTAAAAEASGKMAGAGLLPAGRGGPGEGSRRGGRRSRPVSREGSAHGSTAAYAALMALSAGTLARCSTGVGTAGSPVASRPGSAATVRPGSGAGLSRECQHGSLGGGGARHSRHASDSGVGGSLHPFSAPSSFAAAAGGGGGGGGSLSGSWRGGNAYGSLFPPAAPLHPQLSGISLAELAAGGSYVGCPTATSVTSAAGCPVCMDSRLEAAITPCSHALCLECAQHLSAEDCVPHAATPPLCPLCRGLMGGFRLL